jgi:hypothetical protein
MNKTITKEFSMGKPVAIRKHAILKRHYRRAVKATPQFHQLDVVERWAMLRQQVEADATPTGATLLQIMDSRAGRRDEVLSALEDARQITIR